MKTRWLVTILLVASLSLMAGCSKKEEPSTASAGQEAKETTGVMDNVKNAADKAVETIKEKVSMDIDLDKAVDDLKAEAAQMDIKSLTKIAMKYKDAIVEKQEVLQPLMDKLADIPMTEKLGEEARALTDKIKPLADAVASLKERFGVYIDAIKAKGGDVADLSL